jgi:hypothetical protein
MLQYIVTSPTRVGSHYLISLINSTDAIATKTHNPYLKTTYEKTCLVILRRWDVFAALMSSCIADRFKEYGNYSKTKRGPFAIDCSPKGEFAMHFRFNKWYYPQINLTLPWARVEHLYFEDFFKNHQHVFDRLTLAQTKEITLPRRSPNQYQDLVTNIDECRELFRQLSESERWFVPIGKKFKAEMEKEFWDSEISRS